MSDCGGGRLNCLNADPEIVRLDLIPRWPKARISNIADLTAAFFKGRGHDVSVTPVLGVNDCWDDPNLVSATIVWGIEERHELNDRRWRAVV